MSNETKKTALPKLRFPEFRDAGEWPELTLAESLHEHRLKSDGKSEVHSVSVHKGVINQIEHLGRSFSAANTSKYSLAMPFDIIYTKSPTGDFPYGVIKQNLTGKNVIVSPLYGVFTPSNKYVGNLIHAYFEDPGRTSNYLVSLVQKGAKNTIQISNDRFLSKEIYLPNSEGEQQKIAATLSSLDDLLTAQSAQLAALQAHKRGLMQALFPAEGETVPKLRFPEFQGVGEWEEKTLGDVAKFGSGGTPSKDKPEYWDGDTPWISASSMHNYVIDESELYITDAAKKAGAAIVGKGTLLLLVRGSMLFKRIPMGIAAREVAFNQDVKALHIDEKIATLYLLYYLVSAEKLLLGKVTATGIGAGKLDTADLKQFPICIPSPAEQQKIIDCLSVLDNRISAQTEKIEALQLHKKGLMQHLFPAAAEPAA